MRFVVEIWKREATAALGAKDSGAVKHLWKVAGQRVVWPSSTFRQRRSWTARSPGCPSSV